MVYFLKNPAQFSECYRLNCECIGELWVRLRGTGSARIHSQLHVSIDRKVLQDERLEFDIQSERFLSIVTFIKNYGCSFKLQFVFL